MALKEVCIAARDFGPGRAQEGDIIAVRAPLNVIGTKEGNDFLWLLIDDSQLPSASLRGESIKYRYNLPLAAVAAAHPTIDLERVRNPNDRYQPLRDNDPITGAARRSTQTSGTIGSNIVDREVI